MAGYKTLYGVGSHYRKKHTFQELKIKSTLPDVNLYLGTCIVDEIYFHCVFMYLYFPQLFIMKFFKHSENLKD